jgi:hypothetical protein
MTNKIYRKRDEFMKLINGFRRKLKKILQVERKGQKDGK